jgi:anti-sigma factor RsiW
LQTCPDCLRAHQNVQSLRSAMRNEALYHRAPADLRKSIASAIRTQAEEYVGPAASGVAASGVAASGVAASRAPSGGGLASGPSQGPRLVPAASRVAASGVAASRVPSGGGLEAAKPRQTTRVTAWRWLAVAASVLLVAVTAFTLLRHGNVPSAEDLIAQEAVSDHVRSLMQPNHTVDVPSSDQHTVKPWFNGKLDFSPTVDNLAEQGFPLIGGRLDYLGGRSVAALVYQRHQHYINLFIWSSNGTQETAERFRRLQGYNLVHWNGAGMEYWAVSDLNEGELRQFTDLVQKPPAP